MSKHTGSAGMGSHKHGVSGHGGKHPRFKHNAMIEANRLLQKEHLTRTKRQNKQFSSVKELFDHKNGE